ncbi:hypothetical protein HPB51_019582 [Rhipicephalus microplus]|uniref:Tick transposon n=1 Tax=Rhipicephalus microplus TaxID=6941 RepID=A0A9J6E2U7_RHIMP|nr:hypothetical protein HPB51_019582 [Rhipicephalus microplus]
MDNSSQYEMSLLSAINMLARAWTRVKEETIANCFRACGFMENSGDASPCAPVEVQTNELDDGSFRAALGDVRFDEYVAVDSNVETCGPLTDSEIVQMVRPHDCIPENDDDDDDIGNEPPPRAADVAAGLALAQRFFCWRTQRRRSTSTRVFLTKLASRSQIRQAEDDRLFFLKPVALLN